MAQAVNNNIGRGTQGKGFACNTVDDCCAGCTECKKLVGWKGSQIGACAGTDQSVCPAGCGNKATV